MGIEPTTRCWRATGFEDRGGHQTPIASASQGQLSLSFLLAWRPSLTRPVPDGGGEAHGARVFEQPSAEIA